MDFLVSDKLARSWISNFPTYALSGKIFRFLLATFFPFQSLVAFNGNVILHAELGSYSLRIEFLRIGIIKGMYLVLKTMRTYHGTESVFQIWKWKHILKKGRENYKFGIGILLALTSTWRSPVLYLELPLTSQTEIELPFHLVKEIENTHWEIYHTEI